MQDFLAGCVARYRELSGVVDLEPAYTPFIAEVRDPVSVHERGANRKIVPEDENVPDGKYRAIAPRVLMKILYAARVARFDLLRAVNHLACFFTRWDAACDRRLHQIVCYINTT